MDTNSILSTNALDLLFDGRNKSYGAYELRKNYNKRMFMALAILFISSGIILAFTFTNHKMKARETVVVKEFTIANIKPIKPIIPKENKPKDHAFEKVTKNPIKLEVKSFVPPKIVKDELFENDKKVTKMVDLVDTHISNFNQTGRSGNITAPAIKTNIDGDGFGKLATIGNGSIDAIKEEKETIVTSVQQEARYPSGKEGWMNFLKRNLMSDLPTENGATNGKYTVLISFVVDSDGNVSDVKAENNPGFGTADEAVRVIKKSGKWEPAIQNGKKVMYRQRQQITFIVSPE